jgi:peroxiredoxin
MALVESVLLPPRWKAKDFRLLGTDGKTYSLVDFADAKGLVIVFTCNHCPYAQAAWPVLIDLAQNYQEKGIQFVAINPNDPVRYPEDSFEKMKDLVSEWGIDFPYLWDETQKVAKKYKAQCTPDIYVFNKNRTLFYHGRINDNWQNPDQVTEENLKDALEELLGGKLLPEHQPPSMGCSIKWL